MYPPGPLLHTSPDGLSQPRARPGSTVEPLHGGDLVVGALEVIHAVGGRPICVGVRGDPTGGALQIRHPAAPTDLGAVDDLEVGRVHHLDQEVVARPRAAHAPAAD